MIDYHVTNNKELDLGKEVLYVLQYYAMFDYPLKAEEIYRNCPKACAQQSIKVQLNELEERGKIFREGIFYSVLPDVTRSVSKRLAGNHLASVKKEQALRAGRLIYQFPFVRFVGISGSLSKGYATPDSDFDFFIATSPNRLWICRTLLHVFKKLTFVLGMQEKFCMNYFIDISHPTIEEKNRFTAIELATLVPVEGISSYTSLITANGWLNHYLPNNDLSLPGNTSDKKPVLKSIGEFLLNILAPGLLNKCFMKITDAKWKRKWRKKNYPQEDYGLAFKTTLFVSKNHPANYQKKVLQQIDKKYF